MAMSCQSLLLQGYTISIITVYYHAHVPGHLMWASLAPGPTPSAPKQWMSDVHVKSENSVSMR